MADFVPRPGYFGLKDPRIHLNKGRSVREISFFVIFRKSTFELTLIGLKRYMEWFKLYLPNKSRL